MAYQPTTWQENDLILVDRMNHIEQGIAQAYTAADAQHQVLQANIQQVQANVTQLEEKVLPTGGTTGQMLTKASDNDFDAEWADAQQSGVSMEEVEKEINNSIPDKGDKTFFEIYGIDSSKMVMLTFPNNDMGGLKVATNKTIKNLVANFNQTYLSYSGSIYTCTYNKSTGEIFVKDNNNNKASFSMTVDDKAIYPMPSTVSSDVKTLKVITESSYTSLSTKSSTTLYLIQEEES